MMASSSSSSDLSNADHHHHLLPQADDLPWPCPSSSSSSLPFPQHLHANNIGQLGLGGQWIHPALLMQIEQLSSDELDALLRSAQYHHNIQSQQQLLVGAAPALPHGQLSSSLLMMQVLGFQWSSCCPATLADTAETLTSQQQDALLKEEEEEEEEEVDNRMMRSAPATIVDAYRDSAVVLPSVNVSLLSACDGGGDAFEIMSLSSSSSSPARLCRRYAVSKALANSSSAVLVHNGVPRPPLLRLREQYGGGGPAPAAHRLETLPSIVHSYSKMGSVAAASSDLVNENNGDAHMNGSCCDEQQMQVQVAISKMTKKPPLDSTTTTTIVPSFKVRKEKLGDRIAALQQLVSPFGKTDTASVLMEAIGYIKFLQDQVETLSGPHMQRSSRNKKPRTTTSTQQRGPASNGRGDSKHQVEVVDLRSRGLCLVPLSCTSYVTNENAVWPPPNFRGN